MHKLCKGKFHFICKNVGEIKNSRISIIHEILNYFRTTILIYNCNHSSSHNIRTCILMYLYVGGDLKFLMDSKNKFSHYNLQKRTRPIELIITQSVPVIAKFMNVLS